MTFSNAKRFGRILLIGDFEFASTCDLRGIGNRVTGSVEMLWLKEWLPNNDTKRRAQSQKGQ